jgi:hypothetical protein
MKTLAAVATVAVTAALAAFAPALAAAETTAVVVGGDPGKQPAVVDAIAPWLQGKAQSVVLDALPAAEVDKLVDCFVADDQACAKHVVAGADVNHLVFVMVQVSAEGDVSLSGWLFDATGEPVGTARDACADCRVETLTRTAEALITALWREVEPLVTLQVTSNPSGAEVRVDGAVIGTTPLEHGIAPGAHEVAVSHPGYRTVTRRIEPAAAGTQSLEVTLPRGGGGGRGGMLPWILIGGGGVAVVGGAVLFALDEDVPPLDPSGPEPKHYFDSGTGGAVLLGAGALIAGGGVVLWFLGRRGDDDGGDERPNVVVSPTPGGGTLGWRGSF